MLLALLLTVGSAHAQPLELVASPSATFEVLPTMAKGRVDVAVHRNHLDLKPQLKELRGTGFDRGRATDFGGDWILTLWTDEPGMTVEIAPGETGWTLVPAPLPPNEVPTAPPPDLNAALAGKVDTRTCEPPPIPLLTLDGPDATWPTLAVNHLPRMPMWTAAEPTIADWREVADVRALLREGKGDPATLLYRLGAMHRDLGHLRESALYFKRSAAAGGPEASTALLQAARSELAFRDWPTAAATARQAAEGGAPPEASLAVVSVSAWASNDPAAVGYGRALARASADPEMVVLAAALLGHGRCASETPEMLAGAVQHTVGEPREVARLLLVDGLVARGDLAEAGRQLARLETFRLDPDTARLARVRTRSLALLHQGPEGWIGSLPDLRRDADLSGPAGADALYTLAQVYAHTAERKLEVETWAELVRRYPSRANGAPGRRLAETWAARSDWLVSEGRTLDALALHRAVFNDTLAGHLTDPAPLRNVAKGYASLGLWSRALQAWRDVAELERVHNLDGRDTVRNLAELYVRTGAHEDALDSIRWLRQQPRDPTNDAHILLIEGEAAAKSGRVDLARASWGEVAKGTVLAQEARAHLGLLDASSGHCEAAIPNLREATAPPTPRGFDPGLLEEALLRCLVATGRAADAVGPAVAAAGAATDAGVRGYSTWRASRLDQIDGETNPQLARAAVEAPGVWGALAREESSHEAFRADVSVRGRP